MTNSSDNQDIRALVAALATSQLQTQSMIQATQAQIQETQMAIRETQNATQAQIQETQIAIRETQNVTQAQLQETQIAVRETQNAVQDLTSDVNRVLGRDAISSNMVLELRASQEQHQINFERHQETSNAALNSLEAILLRLMQIIGRDT